MLYFRRLGQLNALCNSLISMLRSPVCLHRLITLRGIGPCFADGDWLLWLWLRPLLVHLRRLGSAVSSSGITVTSARVYNYALPRLNLSKEATCVQDSSCGRFLVSSWPLPLASEVPAGTIDRQGVVPSVASTSIRLNSNAFYLLVRVAGSPTAHSCFYVYVRMQQLMVQHLAAL
jgi:hypothetical protein